MKHSSLKGLHNLFPKFRGEKTKGFLMLKLLNAIGDSEIIKAFTSILVYAIYGCVIGIALIPSVYLVVFSWKVPFANAFAHYAFFAVMCGLALFVYFITGALVMSIAVRILSLGIKPGRYPMISLTMLRWLIYSGIYNLAGKTIFEFIPMSFLSVLFFRIIGARIGKNVMLNSWQLNDAFLLTLGENVVVGGKSDISCHTFEKGCLLLEPVRIGKDTLIGQQCYISPGVTIGERCIIGQHALIRKNAVIPDKSVISSLGGLPLRAISRLEKMEQKIPAQ
jgi:acetyltransferase-like isoleucine patch superfamily enzyme